MKRLATGLLLIVGLINLAPIMGVAGQTVLENMYDVSVASPDVALLLRHRAFLLAIVGLLLIVSAFQRPLRQAAIVAGYFSMLSYIFLHILSGVENEALMTVSYIDIVAIVMLTAAILVQRQYNGKSALPLD